MKIKIFTGPVDSGKTARVKTELRKALFRGRTVGGVVSEAVMSGGVKTGYTAIDLKTGARVLLVSRTGLDSNLRAGAFRFSREGFTQLSSSILNSLEVDVLVIDEIGPLELAGKGFAPALRTVIPIFTGELFLVIRDYLLDEVVRVFKLGNLIGETVDCSLNGPVSFEPWS